MDLLLCVIRMRVYHAHPMCTYQSPREDRERDAIKNHFPEHEIVNPGTYEYTPEKREREMDYCRDLVKTCHSLTFSRLYGHVSSGVGTEIETALSAGIPVSELDEQSVGKRVTRMPRVISREKTNELGRKWNQENVSYRKVAPIRLRSINILGTSRTHVSRP
jgi:hypothetical protein